MLDGRAALLRLMTEMGRACPLALTCCLLVAAAGCSGGTPAAPSSSVPSGLLGPDTPRSAGPSQAPARPEPLAAEPAGALAEPEEQPLVSNIEPGTGIWDTLAGARHADHAAAPTKRLREQSRWLDIDAEYIEVPSVPAVGKWELALLRRIITDLRSNAAGLAASEVVPSNASTQKLRARPVILLDDEQFVTVAITTEVQRLWNLGPVRATRCATIRRGSGVVIRLEAVRKAFGERMLALGIDPQEDALPCLTAAGLWLCSPTFESPFEQDEAPIFPGKLITFEALGGQEAVTLALAR